MRQIIGPYFITLADPSGGKAGKDCNITSTVQVYKEPLRVKQFVYKTPRHPKWVPGARSIAWQKAVDWCNEQIKQNETQSI